MALSLAEKGVRCVPPINQENLCFCVCVSAWHRIPIAVRRRMVRTMLTVVLEVHVALFAWHEKDAGFS
eukprot:2379824-Prymnesium_polylepis.1